MGSPELRAAPAQRAAAEEHTRAPTRPGASGAGEGKSPEMPSQGAAAAPHGHGKRRSSGRPAPRLSGAGSPSLHGRFRSSRPPAGAVQRGGAGPGAASATRSPAHQDEAADWWSRGGGRAHGERCAGPWRCCPGQSEACARPRAWSRCWVPAPRGLLSPAAAGESPATSTHLSPRPRIAGT